ncbi:TRAP transporter substrate-binding protein [Pelagibius litoralis]|uniref:TRAP transporter substrate-binding protein n=2 Tax=Pelagibius litoralis TaxID=374515 RepID=A0A967EVW1_9PROT|nr:TRAP transporter substrate-binding protein [Pelagibius litoralis]
MATSWPKNSPGPGRSAERLAERITLMSGAALRVEVFGAGDLLPPLEVFDGVAGATVEMGHSAAFFWRGKMPASVFFTAVPFGLTPDEHAAWITQGGGQGLWDELYGASGVKPFMAGNSGIQMGGWFTREIGSLADLQGLKFRIPGLGGEVYRRLGATAVVVPPGEIFAALQSGLVDGAEFLGPWSDAAFGFYKVAPYYYWPGFHEPNGTGECLINKAAFDALRPDLQAIVTVACAAEAAFALAEADWQNAQRLKWLVEEKGVQLRAFPPDVVDRARMETSAVLDDLAARDLMSAKILPSYRTALARAKEWSRVGRGAYLAARDG